MKKYTGDLKSLCLLWTALAKTSYNQYVTDKDLYTFQKRVDNEGLSFLTVTLPTIGKALDNLHSTMLWSSPPDFKSGLETIRLPEWAPFNGFIDPSSAEKVCDPDCNMRGACLDCDWVNEKEYESLLDASRNIPRLREGFIDGFRRQQLSVPHFLGTAIVWALNGDPSAVDCVRQLSYMFYKLEVDYDETTRQQYLDRFVQTDSRLVDAIDFEDDFTSKLVAEMRRMLQRILCNEDPMDIRPCHGSGATACRTSNGDKWHKLRYYKKLDHVFPYSEYFFFSATHLADELQRLEASQDSVPMARVCLVPKDSRGPRIISCEPAELLYIQQGLMRKLYRCLESSPLTAGQVNFTDQSVNQKLACDSSITGEHATIDLSDASDRVSLALVSQVFPGNWFEALEACRSESTLLPDGRVVKLQKFAPMGSSVCFPVEALVFWTCVQATIRITTPNSRERIYVYGDDIIVPSSFYEVAMKGLESIGLVVNRSKSFSYGPFRESCGGEYYAGTSVAPVRVRNTIRRQGSGLATSADLANEFIAKFGYESALPLIKIIEEQLGYTFPRSPLGLPCTIGYDLCASNDVFLRRKWNFEFQRWEHRVLTLTSSVNQLHPPNWEELLRKELSRDVATSGKYMHPLAIMDSLVKPGYYTEAHSVRTKWAWVWLG